MNEPQFTIRVQMKDVFHEGAFVAMRDVEAKNFFLLGLNFPKA